MHADETGTGEALLDALHGFPRDLNADGDALDTDVSGDYRILPFTVRVHWDNQGASTVNQMEALLTRQ